jgi:hypothetical protein
MGERGVEVVDVGVESGEVRLAAGAHEHPFRSVLLGQPEVVAVVPLADGPLVAGGGKALGGVGADRFEHPEPGDGVRVAGDEHVLGDEPVERVEIGAGDRLGRLGGRAAGEDRKGREALLLGVAEHVVAPVDRRAQRPLAGGRIAGPLPNAPSAVSRRSAISTGDSNPQRAAASSIASGSPSTRRQISATAAALASPMRKSGSWTRARSQNSATAGTRTSASASSSSSGNASGATGYRCSPASASASRLVASTLSAGQALSNSDTKCAAASTCSTLSSTSNKCLAERKRVTACSGPSPETGTIPSD